MHDHPAAGGADLLSVLALILAILAGAGYLAAVRVARRPWPVPRTVCWVLGLLIAVAAVAGPLGEWAHKSFESHVLAHLLLGMLAPLLMVVAAPATVALRALPVPSARRLSRVLGSLPIRVATEPVVAALLTVGGLWLLYTTELFAALRTSPAVNAVVHVHMFVAGYLFTAAMIGADPMPHRRSYRHRAVVLIVALAFHDILAKYLYAHSPAGVPADAAQSGAMIMYYGGDAVDLAIIVLLCAGWYRTHRRSRCRSPWRSSRAASLPLLDWPATDLGDR